MPDDGRAWLEVLKFAMADFKDESFIAQFLSPRLMREFRLFSVLDDEQRDDLEVTAIHDEAGYRHLRGSLADQYNLGSREPNIQVYDVDLRGDRSLTLRHYRYHDRPLAGNMDEMLRHIRRLWGFTVRMETVDERGQVKSLAEC